MLPSLRRSGIFFHDAVRRHPISRIEQEWWLLAGPEHRVTNLDHRLPDSPPRARGLGHVASHGAGRVQSYSNVCSMSHAGTSRMALRPKLAAVANQRRAALRSCLDREVDAARRTDPPPPQFRRRDFCARSPRRLTARARPATQGHHLQASRTTLVRRRRALRPISASQTRRVESLTPNMLSNPRSDCYLDRDLVAYGLKEGPSYGNASTDSIRCH